MKDLFPYEGDHLHEMSNPIFREKIFQIVVCWIFYPAYWALIIARSIRCL